jgi:sugar phosphate isomerase/epimerase
MVELALSPDRRWEATPTELVRAAAAAGFAAVGMFEDRADAGLRATFDAAGVRCHVVLALMVGDDADETIADARRLAAAASVLDADWVLTVFRSQVTSDVEAVVHRCAAMFADAGAGTAVEFSPLGPVSSIPLGLDVVRSVARAGVRVGLMIDTWHFERGDSTWEDLEAVPLDEVAYVQFDDALAPAGGSERSETMHRRAVPGDGVFDLGRFASTLRDRGWDGLVSVEVLSAELRALPIDDIARRLHDATARYWG